MNYSLFIILQKYGTIQVQFLIGHVSGPFPEGAALKSKEDYNMKNLKRLAALGTAAVLAAGIAQAALCAGSPGAPAALFAVADAGMGLACLAFPAVIFWYLLHRRMCR